MAMGMVGLVGGEVIGVDLAPGAVCARARAGAGPLEQLDDPRVGRGEPPRELDRVALVVLSLRGDRVLVVRRDRRPVLVDAPLHAVGEDLGRVGDMADDLEGGPLVELRGAKAIDGHRTYDPRYGRRVVREPERFVFVVLEAFHVLLLSRM